MVLFSPFTEFWGGVEERFVGPKKKKSFFLLNNGVRGRGRDGVYKI